LDPVNLIGLLDRRGIRCPIEVEVLSDELAKLDPADVAHRARDAAHKILDLAT
jgi:hypothetical protein